MHIVDIEHHRTHIDGHPHLPDAFQTWEAGVRLPRHRHFQPYATVIVAGGFRECGNWGRLHAGPGDVLIHRAFDIHMNEIFAAGAQVIHLTLAGPEFASGGLGHLRDLDAFVRVAKSSIPEAKRMLRHDFVRSDAVPRDWPDILAVELTTNPNRRLEDWAAEQGLAVETVTRGFDRLFGVTPAIFRAEARARKAFEQIVSGEPFLAEVCEAVGFADQPHMCRAVKSLTGDTPFTWVRRAARARRTVSPGKLSA